MAAHNSTGVVRYCCDVNQVVIVAPLMDVKTAIANLQQDNVDLRIDAAAALVGLRAPEAFEPLLTALGDDDYRVRAWAASALGWLGDNRAADALVTLLYESPESEWDIEVNPPTCASFALALLGVAQPILPLLTDVDEHVRSLAVVTLRYIGDMTTISALAAVRDNDPIDWVCVTAADAIRQMQSPDYKPLRHRLE